MSDNPEIVTKNYPWGTIESISSYVNEQLHGLQKKFHYTGNIASEEYFIKGLKEGVAKYYSEEGILFSEVNFLNNNKHAVEKIYFKEREHQGKISNINYWENGKRHGTLQEFNTSGNLIRLETYSNDVRCGLFEEYNHEGIPISSYNWKDNNTRDGIQKDFYANGQPRSIYCLKDGKQHGPSIHYHFNGQISSISCFQDGVESKDLSLCMNQITSIADTLDLPPNILEALGNNIEINYYDDGTPKEKYTWHAGIKEGQYRFWYPDGSIAERGQYKNNLLDGYIMAYYPNGKIKLIGNFEAGKKHGAEKEYRDNGQLVQERIWEKGKDIRLKLFFQNGVMRTEVIRENLTVTMKLFNDLAILYRIISFKNYDLPLTGWVPDTAKGNNPSKEIDYFLRYSRSKNIVLEGKESTFIDGKIYNERNFKEDMLEGESTTYYPDGKVYSVFTYKKNNIRSRLEYSEYGSIEIDEEYFEDGSLKIKRV